MNKIGWGEKGTNLLREVLGDCLKRVAGKDTGSEGFTPGDETGDEAGEDVTGATLGEARRATRERNLGSGVEGGSGTGDKIGCAFSEDQGWELGKVLSELGLEESELFLIRGEEHRGSKESRVGLLEGAAVDDPALAPVAG